jgi:exosortase
MSQRTSETLAWNISKLPCGRTARFGVFLLLSVCVFWVPLRQLVALSLRETQYNHILVVPFISLCLLYWKRQAIFGRCAYNFGVGLPLLFIAITAYGAFAWPTVSLGSAALSVAIFFMILVWFGSFILCYGAAAFHAARFPLFLLLLMVPIPLPLMDKVIFCLQTGSAQVCSVFFQLAGVPVLQEGFRFYLPDISINIAKECSSIHSSWALLITGLLGGHIFLRSFWSKFCLAALTVPIAMFTNGVRIFGLSWLATHVSMGFLTGNLHHRGGILFSLISVIILLGFLVLLAKLDYRRPVSGPEETAIAGSA